MLPLQQPEQDTPLPPLRQDLQIIEGAAREDGAPTWNIHDPVRNSFYSIGRLEFEILSRWEYTHAGDIVASVNEETTLTIQAEDVALIHDFLLKNCLLSPLDPNAGKYVLSRMTAPGPNLFSWFLKNYLFFRIPIFNPDDFLIRTFPLVRMFFSKVSLTILGMATLFALLLIEHHWESFFHTFLYFFSFQGIFLYGLTLFGVKLLHELGHAYTSKYFGLNVPSIGIAFLVMWPVLYSDNSDAWRLKSRKARMAIVAAGTIVELSLAIVGTILWAFIPDGPLRSACFLVATVTWISSLLINLSPFMRFDGYYFLSDFLGVPNLAPRAFALAKWKMRSILLGLTPPPPEYFSRSRQHILISYAWGTWIYRLLLFLGIAFMVYHYFFKALGIFLFLVEISVFVINPVIRELKAWWLLRPNIGCNGHILTSTLLCILLIAWMIIPTPATIMAPAVLKSRQATHVYPPFSCRIQKILVRNGDEIQQGAPLFSLESPDLNQQITMGTQKIATLKIALDRQKTTSNRLEQSLITFQECFKEETNLQGLHKQQQRLVITAPFAGVIKDIPPGLGVGSWINQSQFLGTLFTPNNQIIDAYVEEQDVHKIILTNQASFYHASGDLPPIACNILFIEQSSPTTLEEPSLASPYGGSLPVRQDRKNELVLEKSYYRIRLAPLTPLPSLGHTRTGTVVLKGIPDSTLLDTLRYAYAIIIRETGF